MQLLAIDNQRNVFFFSFFFLVTDPGGGGGKATSTTTLGFSHEPDDVVVQRGGSARLDCLVRLPPPVDRNNSSQSPKHLEEPIAFDILWFQDGQPVLLPDQRRHLLANGSLYFDKVKTHSSPMRRPWSHCVCS